MNQNIIWVDLMDHEIGYGGKLETHQKNILHRAFSVFLYANGKMIFKTRLQGERYDLEHCER